MKLFKTAIILLILLLFIAVNGVKAQNTCATAANMQFDTTLTYQITNGGEYWFKFKAANKRRVISVVLSAQQPKAIAQVITLYSGSCSNLVMMKSKSKLNGDSLVISSDSLIINSDYYVKVYFPPTTNLGLRYFNLRNALKIADSYINVTWAGPPSGDIVCTDLAVDEEHHCQIGPICANNPISIQYGNPSWVDNDGATIAFDFQTTNITYIQGSNQPSPTNDPIIVEFTTPGTYEVICNVTGICMGVYYFDLIITNDNADATFVINPNPLCPGDHPIVTLVNPVGNTITSINWGSTVTDCLDPNNTMDVGHYFGSVFGHYERQGTYLVTVQATGTCGLATSSQNVNVSLRPDFTYTINCDTTISFNGTSNCSTGAISEWRWNFGDGSPTVTGQNPTHHYAAPGTYNVTLTVSDMFSYCPGTSSKMNTVTISPAVIPVFTGTNNSCTPSAIYTITSPRVGTYSYKLTGCQPVPITPPSFTVTFPITSPQTWTGDITITFTDAITLCVTSYTLHIFSCCTKAGTPTWTTSTNNTPQTITTATTGLFINGTITLNADLTFNTSKLLMGPQAKFIVNAGAKLTINTTTVEQGCQYMWDGMYAQSPTAKIEVINSSTVKDAINGIVSENGGNIKLTGSTFKSNYISAIIRNYSAAVHPAYIRGCLFTNINTNYKLVYAPLIGSYSQAGVRIANIGNSAYTAGLPLYPNAVTIGDTLAGVNGGDFASNTYCNRFENLIFGIYSTSSNVNVYNASYNTSLPAPYAAVCQAVRMTGPKFLPVQLWNKAYFGVVGGSDRKRIRVINAGFGIATDTNLALTAVKNIIVTAPYGIFVADVKYWPTTLTSTVNWNTIGTSTMGITFLGNASHISQVNQNIITMTSSAVGGIVAYGLGMATENYIVKNNNITGNSYAIYMNNVVGNGYTNDVSINTINLNSTGGIGIQSQGCNFMKINTNTITGISNSYSTGIWAALSNNLQINCNTITKLQQAIIYDGSNFGSTGSSTFRNNFNNCSYAVYKANNGMAGNIGTSTMACGFTFTTMPVANQWFYANTSAFGEKIYYKAQGNQNISTLNVTPITGAQRWFLQTPLANTTLDFDCFPLSRQMLIGNNINNNGNPLFTDIANDNIQYLGPNDARYLTRQALYKVLMADTTDPVNNADMHVFKSNIHNSDMGMLARAEMSISNNDIAQARILNNSAGNGSIIEKAQKFINNCYIALSSNIELTQAQIADVRDLAAKCPFKYGNAVYRARSLAAIYDGPGMIYSNNCENNNNQNNHGRAPEIFKSDTTAANTSATDIVSVYPNPASDNIIVEYNLSSINGILKIEFYNMIGTLVCTKEFEGNSGRTRIGLNNLGNGTYMYKVLTYNNVYKTGKLVIVK